MNPFRVIEVREEEWADATLDAMRIQWLHSGSSKDAEGYEWGVFRVKWDEQGQPMSVLHTLSDMSDLDAEMRRNP